MLLQIDPSRFPPRHTPPVPSPPPLLPFLISHIPQEAGPSGELSAAASSKHCLVLSQRCVPALAETGSGLEVLAPASSAWPTLGIFFPLWLSLLPSLSALSLACCPHLSLGLGLRLSLLFPKCTNIHILPLSLPAPLPCRSLGTCPRPIPAAARPRPQMCSGQSREAER